MTLQPIDEDLLDELGLGVLPDVDKEQLIEHMRHTLEMRVGARLTDGLTPEQLGEVGDLMDGDPAALLEWMKVEIPDMNDVVADEMQRLRAEIAAAVPFILEDAGVATNDENRRPG